MINIDNAIQQFLISQELKGNTEKTISYYNNNLRYFMDFVGKDKIIADLRIADLNNYLLHLKRTPKMQNHPFRPKTDQPKSSVTIQTYVKALRGFLGWLHDDGYLEEDFRKRFKLPKATKRVIEILSDDEIESIMKCFTLNAEIGLRNAVLFGLMLDCGLRRNEILFMDYDQIHFTQGIIKVKGKGNKERIVPLGLYAKKLLMKYLNGYRSMPNFESKRLLISKALNPLSENAVNCLFIRLRKRTGIERLHPHIVRHTFATKYLMNGGDIFSLQHILGHTSIEMVRKYSHLASSYMVDNHKKLSPLDGVIRKKTGY